MQDTSSAYQRIKSLKGMDEFKLLADKLCTVAQNKKVLRAERFVLPGFLFASAPGCGATTHLRLFAQLLQELDLQRFEGEQKVFEHVITYSKNEGENADLEKLLYRLSAMAGFRSNFRGVIGLDIDEWVEHADEKAMNSLLAFASDYAEYITIVYEVELRPERDIEPIISRLANEVSLEVVRIPMPDTKQLMTYLETFIKRRGCYLSDDAIVYLKPLIADMRETKMFDGLQTLDNLADEIVYRLLSSGRIRSTRVEAKSLEFISEKDGFIDRLRAGKNKSVRRTIGFM